MKTVIFLAAYGLANDLLHCYNTANQNDFTWLLYLHSQRPKVVDVCEALATQPNVLYFPYGKNRGMSKSINEAILYAQGHGAETFVSLNDDVICPSSRLRELVGMARVNPDSAYVQAHGYTARIGQHEPLGFSCCAWNMRAFERVGLFDENFHPFYFMDCDWKRRALLLDIHPITLNMSDVIHGGSKTITHVDGEADWLRDAFDKNKALYLAKWGGDQKLETFATPFNDPALGLRIDAAQRADPYPAYRPAWRERVS